jgi:light-regulated signal transduction histidine kinase (bacteriophytochrome)
MTGEQDLLAGDVDLTNCDREAIHIPGSIQAHGFLLALAVTQDERFRVVVASENAAHYLGRPTGSILNAELGEILPLDIEQMLQRGLLSEGASGDFARFIGTMRLVAKDGTGADFQIVGHRVGTLYLLEFERTESSISQGDLNTVITNFVSTLEESRTSLELCAAITVQIRALTGFDRVMLYQFDEVGHGTVLAEDRNERLPSYLGLRFPATDIPKQARALYVSNRIRIIPDVDYEPSPLLSIPAVADDGPIDLSLSILRSVSPIHRDYMRNMGTISSMSVSIVSEGRLWGLISAHHSEPRRVPYLVRSACDVLSRIMSAQLLSSQKAGELAHAIRLKSVHSQLLTFMASGESYIDGLARHPAELCAVVGAKSAAIVVDGRCVRLGDAPYEEDVLRLSDWLARSAREEVFATGEIGSEFPESEALNAKGSGVLAISLSQIHRMQIFWFRPEVIESVHWAGEPTKDQELIRGVLHIHPRNSFASWKQILRGKSERWASVEIESAREFRNSVLEIVLKRAEELADIAAELEVANRELEAFSYSVSHDLRAPFRHISGFADLLMQNEAERLTERGRKQLATISESAQFAGLLVDSLLNFSRITRTKLNLRPIAMKILVEAVWKDVVKEELEGRSVDFQLDELPVMEVDVDLMRQVWRNLLSNAVKYTRKQPNTRISVSAAENDGEIVFSVDDNGVGFDGQYAHKLFGAFQRLHRMEDFEGTGIGLANVRRIVSRLGGRTWATGQEGVGASIFFSLPLRSRVQLEGPAASA